MLFIRKAPTILLLCGRRARTLPRMARTPGTVRKLPSGKWQARTKRQDGRGYEALGTFTRKIDAEKALAAATTDQARGAYVAPSAGRVLFESYARAWLQSPPRPLRPKTIEGYDIVLRLHLAPTFGQTELSRITPESVRAWYGALVAAGVGDATRAKAYRFLRAVMTSAVTEDKIVKNPCRLVGAGDDNSPERPLLTIEQVYEIADAIAPRYRALVLLAAFSGLRLGELLGLAGRHVDLLHREIRVERQYQEIGGNPVYSAPKTRAGVRTVAIPDVVVRELEAHLAAYAQPGPDGLVFPNSANVQTSPHTFREGSWRTALRHAGLPHEGVGAVHIHDLRHHAATLAARTPGVSTRELMARLGHVTPDVAIRYQHASNQRDHEIAAAMGAVVPSRKTGQA